MLQEYCSWCSQHGALARMLHFILPVDCWFFYQSSVVGLEQGKEGRHVDLLTAAVVEDMLRV